MAFSLAPLLIHSESIPHRAREALRSAALAPAEQKKTALASAARILHSETSIDCRDAMEIVGLNAGCGCD
jgi:hypothetical protein